MRRALGLFAAALLSTGCGAAVPSSPGTTVSDVTEAPSGTPTSAPSAAVEAWDLVWFSDSSVAAAVDAYATKIQERLGVTVRVHNFWGPAERGSAVFIAEMTEVAAVEQAIVDAEVIILYANPARTSAGDALAAACVFETQGGIPPENYTAADFKEFAERLQFLYGRIFELRSGRTAVIRAVDAYVASLADWKAAGIERECTSGWEAWTSLSRSVASEYGVPMASMYDAMNGPKHDQDPKDQGLIGPDGVHPSEAGTVAQVAVLDALGYDPISR